MYGLLLAVDPPASMVGTTGHLICCMFALQGLSDVFDCTPYLWKLDLTGNPLTHHAKYRDKVITMVKGIGMWVGGVTGVGGVVGSSHVVVLIGHSMKWQYFICRFGCPSPWQHDLYVLTICVLNFIL